MNEQALNNLIKVHEYLDEQGWSVSRSTIYNHAKKGWLVPDKEGAYPTAAVDEYAEQRLKMKDGSTQRPDKLAQDLRETELRLKRAKAEREEHKAKVEKGRFIPLAQFEAALVGRARIFKQDLHNLATGEAPDMVALVEGERDNIPDLIEFLEERFEELLDRYTREEELLA